MRIPERTGAIIVLATTLLASPALAQDLPSPL